jgi:hypothetical protein
VTDRSELPAELRARLARLHDELGRQPPDAESRRLLLEACADIERRMALAESSLADSSSADEHSAPGPAPRLESLAVRFEAEHPDLAGSLRQLVDLLGRAGI